MRQRNKVVGVVCTLLVTLIGGRTVAASPDDPYIDPAARASDQQRAARFRDDLAKAKAGDAAAMSAVGEDYLLGDGTPSDPAQAMEWIRSAAEKGNGHAMYRLGDIYQMGNVAGVERDLKKSLEWYQRGADSGDASAMAGVGWMYFNGYGVERNVGTAVRWYQKSADAKSPEGMNNLGFAYRYGHVVQKDLAKAVELFTRAADGGNAWGMFNLAEMYSTGEGVTKDPDRADTWYARSAAAGHPDAAAWLANLYLGAGNHAVDYAKAMLWAKRAAQSGHPQGMREVGFLYFRGLGVKRDPVEALGWYQRAMDAGNAESVVDVAGFYMNGDTGIPADPKRAIAMLEQAAARESLPAMHMLANMYWTGDGVLKDPAKARELTRRAETLEAAPDIDHLPLSFSVPEAWRVLPGIPMAVAALSVGEGKELVRITISFLPADNFKLGENVNRWRAQLGLESVDDALAKAAPRSITIGGKPAQLIDLRSTLTADNPSRILVAVVQRQKDSVAIIKMMGPATSVNQQEQAFETFLKSVQFKEGDEKK
jgi:TPR repeat protein